MLESRSTNVKLVKNSIHTSKGNLNLYIRTVHEGMKPYSCEICDYRFTAPKQLSIHVATVHEGKKLFGCKICGKELTSNHYLKDHISSVHEGKYQEIQV